jgi:hypothetical protein
MTNETIPLRRRIDEIRKSHWLPIGFFIVGYLFDAMVVERIDTPIQVAQIVVYTLALAGLILLRTLREHGAWTPGPRAEKAWKYREFATQFLLGTLLNLYSLFYFKSASLSTSIFFMLFVAGLILANEFARSPKWHAYLELALWFTCVCSLWIAFVPLAFGFVGYGPFIVALALSSICVWGFRSLVARKIAEPTAARQVARAGSAIVALFLVAYLLRLIPPVPLAVQSMGFYRDVKREGREYALQSCRPRWRFWERGDQTFLARPGDRIIAFASVFAPKGFTDTLMFQWRLHTENGWKDLDRIPITVSGGREEGYRGYTIKSNYQPGDYRVQVETTDGREVGRLSLRVEADSETGPRECVTVLR